MKILHISNAYPYAGYTSYGVFVREQIESLGEIGIETDVVFINARLRGNLEYIKRAQDVRKLADQSDIVHCHHPFSVIPYLLSLPRKPLVVSLMGDHEGERTSIRVATRIASLRTSVVIYKGRRPKLHGHLIHLPNGVDTRLFRPGPSHDARTLLGLNADAVYVLFVSAAGPGNPVKRHDIFLNVLNGLRRVGEPVEPLYLTGVVRHLVPYYYQAANALLLTSDHEGSPNCIKEAMACSVPFVSTDVGNVRTLAADCPGCFVASGNSMEELSGLVLDALRHGPSNGRRRIEDFGLDTTGTARKLVGVYETVLTDDREG